VNTDEMRSELIPCFIRFAECGFSFGLLACAVPSYFVYIDVYTRLFRSVGNTCENARSKPIEDDFDSMSVDRLWSRTRRSVVQTGGCDPCIVASTAL
jgi:hypothetical protein